MYGGAGSDRMQGGGGDDWFYAVDAETDFITGGAHDKGDHAQIDWPDPNTTVRDFARR